MELYELLKLAEIRSIKISDGHLTLMRFTTGWKCVYGTPAMNRQSGEEYWKLVDLATYETIEDALSEMVNKETRL